MPRGARIETNRVGMEVEDAAVLCMIVSEPYRTWIDFWKLQERQVGHYVFAYIFEQSFSCGESGVHRYISDITIKDGPPMFGAETFAVIASLTINLEDYDKLRLRRPNVGRGKDLAPFPEYERMAG
jgi:hypothetical protein